MKLKNIALILISGSILLAFIVPKGLDKKVDKEVRSVFEIESYTYNAIKVSEEVQKKTPSKLTDNNFFLIRSGGKLEGYVYVDKAPSKTAQFDYLVIFDSKLRIISTKVLVYREEYGGEIGSRRWLKQFIGKSGGDSLDDVAAISGATISVRSMKNAVGNILKTVTILKDQKIIQ